MPACAHSISCWGLPELMRLRSSPEMARELLGRIPPLWQQKLEGGLEVRWRKQRGNLRELWLECFDLAREAEV